MAGVCVGTKKATCRKAGGSVWGGRGLLGKPPFWGESSLNFLDFHVLGIRDLEIVLGQRDAVMFFDKRTLQGACLLLSPTSENRVSAPR